MVEQFSIENEQLKVRILRKGAELCSVIDKTSGREFIWQAHSVWERYAPNLFPVVGSLLDHEYIYNGRTYPMKHHGFARDLDFDMLQQSEHSISLVLANSERTVMSYPFSFTLLITFTLEANSIVQSFRVINDGEGVMPTSFGGHPAFAVDGVANYSLIFDQYETVQSNTLEGPYIGGATKDVIQGDTIALDKHIFDDDALVFEGLNSRYIRLQSNVGSHAVTVDVSEFPYLGIWAKPGADYVCIEPWQGLADLIDHNKEISNKKGIVMLEPQQEIKRSFRMTFDS